jgi:glyoxylase-like metal-dependent hydrolase (beta-lactamase superfamily II)
MKLRVEPKPLTEPLPGGSSGATVTIEPIEVGQVQMPHGFIESTGGRLAKLHMLGLGTPRSKCDWLPVPAYLIRHPSAGNVLVDTGLHPSVSAKPSANIGRIMAWYTKPRLENGHDLPAQLRSRGIEARDIRLVVMTHLHFDHASGMAEFPGATYVLSEREWEAATTDRRPFFRGYRPEHYDYAFDYRTVSYDAGSVSSYGSFGHTFDLFGDGSVRLVSTPGHSAGHQSVIARLKDRDFVVAGDLVYTRAQLEGRAEQPNPADPHTLRRSLQELRLFHRQYPDAVIVPGHDPELWATLEKKYE